MLGKRRLEQLLAAAAYDDMTPEEEAALSKRIARDPSLAEESNALRHFASQLPNDPPAFEGNLLPAVRAQLAIEAVPSASRSWGRLGAYAVATACVLAAFGGALMLPGNGNPSNPNPTASNPNGDTPLSLVIAESHTLRNQGDATGAYALLTEALAEHGDDLYAAEVQLALASLAFEELQWYSEAEEAYDAFARDYTTAYLMHPDSATIAFRRNLLAEARASAYEPLYALIDAGSQLPELERILARHPAGFVATQAADQMLASIPGTASDVEALEQVRERCTDPIALAHLDVELAERYAYDLGDGIRARELLEDVVQRQESHYAVLAAEKLMLLPVE